jgi:hypothetical protein
LAPVQLATYHITELGCLANKDPWLFNSHAYVSEVAVQQNIAFVMLWVHYLLETCPIYIARMMLVLLPKHTTDWRHCITWSGGLGAEPEPHTTMFQAINAHGYGMLLEHECQVAPDHAPMVSLLKYQIFQWILWQSQVVTLMTLARARAIILRHVAAQVSSRYRSTYTSKPGAMLVGSSTTQGALLQAYAHQRGTPV